MFSFMDNRRGKTFSIVLAFFLFLSFSNAYAFSNDDWLKVPEQQNENTKVSGSKTYSDGRKATSSVIVPPNVSRVVRQIVKLGAVIAVTDAITQLIGAGVDWVLDPANNRVIYTKDNQPVSCTNASSCGATDYYLFYREPGTNGSYYTNVDSACSAVASYFNQTLQSVTKFYDTYGRVSGAMCYTKKSTGADDQWGLMKITNPVYDPTAQPPTPQELYKTYEELARQIIANAAAAKPAAPEFILLSNTDLTPEEEKALDQQLEANKKYDTNNTAKSEAENTPTGASEPTSKTSTETQLPPACEYFPTLCEWLDWTKTDTPITPDDSPVPVTEMPNIPMNADTFQATAGCPAPLTAPINFGGQSSTLEISYEPICQFAEKWSFVSPLIGFLSAAMIVVGVGRKGDEQSV